MFAGRTELPIGGPWRVRVEGAAASWRLERQIYSDDRREIIATETLERISVGQLIGMIGLQVGHPPVCAYVLAGGGLYSLSYEGGAHRNPGLVGVAGIEIPAGAHGAVQVEGQLHVITTDSHYPIGSTAVLDGRLAVGWLYRF
jgi:hypothetical protein